MFNVVYTKAITNVSDAGLKVYNYDCRENAIATFQDLVRRIVNEVLNNEYLKGNFNIHDYKAVICVESVKYCIFIQES